MGGKCIKNCHYQEKPLKKGIENAWKKIIEPQRRREHREKIGLKIPSASSASLRLNRSICSVCRYQKASDVFSDTPVSYFMTVASSGKQSGHS